MKKIMFWIYDHVFGPSLDRLLLAQREDVEGNAEY